MIEVGSLLGSGWACGLNLYLVVAMLGIAGRMEVVNAPGPVQNYLVIAAAAALYAVEFIVDKIPVLDSMWDVAHTVIRPVGAATLAYSFAAHDAGSRSPIASAAIAAAVALTSHGAKATTRIVVNASPEPFTNIAASLTEDGLAGGM